MVFLCRGSLFRTLASDVRAGGDGGTMGTMWLKVRNLRSRLASSCSGALEASKFSFCAVVFV
jgi:hypothetical protein